MNNHQSGKLFQFIENAPEGSVFTNTWLKQNNISSKLVWWYLNSGLLERVGTKAYKKIGEKMITLSAIHALQNQMKLSAHIGGMTALQLCGQAEIKCFGIKEYLLFMQLGMKMPSWLFQHEWINDQRYEATFKIIRTSLFENNDTSLGIVNRTIDKFTVSISCLERAVMEILYLSPRYHALFDTTELMESLKKMKWDPSITQILLENCNSIKVKRFFLYFADRFWKKLARNLDISRIDLGNGKRVIGRGGDYRYHPKYMLSLPVKIDEPDE